MKLNTSDYTIESKICLSMDDAYLYPIAEDKMILDSTSSNKWIAIDNNFRCSEYFSHSENINNSSKPGWQFGAWFLNDGFYAVGLDTENHLIFIQNDEVKVVKINIKESVMADARSNNIIRDINYENELYTLSSYINLINIKDN